MSDKPVLDPPARGAQVFWFIGIAAAVAALAALARRMLTRADVGDWSMPFALVAGIALADFLSGIVHWAADTWGRDDMPVIGKRVLVPFRVHHVNPDDFLQRRFLDTNGDVAWLTLPLVFGLFQLPLDTRWGSLCAVFGVGLCATGMFTNQIHQWAHMPSPPRIVRLLQDGGVLLGRAEHAGHHAGAYDRHYCITTGWCNRSLEAVGFFRRLERVIERLTGARPRADDRRYASRT